MKKNWSPAAKEAYIPQLSDRGSPFFFSLSVLRGVSGRVLDSMMVKSSINDNYSD